MWCRSHAATRVYIKAELTWAICVAVLAVFGSKMDFRANNAKKTADFRNLQTFDLLQSLSRFGFKLFAEICDQISMCFHSNHLIAVAPAQFPAVFKSLKLSQHKDHGN